MTLTRPRRRRLLAGPSIRGRRVAAKCVGHDVSKVERGGHGSRTGPVVVEVPVLVPTLSEAERVVAVSVLREILAASWAKQEATDGGEPDARMPRSPVGPTPTR
jgi:hypothetical protein